MKELTQERLKEVLEYDPESGTFKWLVVLSNRVRAGSTAGTIGKYEGYIIIMVDGRSYRAHRLAWLYMFGTWPKHQIDHINGLRDDNRLCNLRDASSGDNQFNIGIRAHNNSGVKGVSRHATTGKWQVRVNAGGRAYFFGCHNDLELAELVASEARAKLHGEFSRDR